MKKTELVKLRARLERRLINATWTEMHRDSMRKAYADTGTVKMHEFRGGRTVSISKDFGNYHIIVWNGSDHAFIENRFFTEEEAVTFTKTLWGNIGWNIK